MQVEELCCSITYDYDAKKPRDLLLVEGLVRSKSRQWDSAGAVVNSVGYGPGSEIGLVAADGIVQRGGLAPDPSLDNSVARVAKDYSFTRFQVCIQCPLSGVVENFDGRGFPDGANATRSSSPLTS